MNRPRGPLYLPLPLPLPLTLSHSIELGYKLCFIRPDNAPDQGRNIYPPNTLATLAALAQALAHMYAHV